MTGLDIGCASVRAAEIIATTDGVRLLNFGQVALPEGAVMGGEIKEPATVTNAIRRLWKERKFSQSDVVMGVANQQVVVRTIDLPWVAAADIKRSLPFLVADMLPLPVDEAVLDFLPLDVPEEGKPIHGLLVASPRNNITATVRCAEAAGLRPVAVDLASFALLRAVGRGRLFNAEEKVDERRKPGPATEVLVDIGGSVTNIVIHRGGVPKIVRIVLRGGDDITAVLQERLGITVADAEDLKRQQGMVGKQIETTNLISLAVTPLVEEIRSSLDYYTSTHAGARVERVRLCGGGSSLRGLVDVVHKALGLHVERADPLWNIQVEGKNLDINELELFRYQLAVPIGLALGPS